MTLKGEWQVDSTNPPIDPIENGFTFKVDDTNGDNVFYRVLPGGAAATNSDPGWTSNRTKTRWTFKDKTGVIAAGITKVIIRDRSSKAPSLFSIKVVGKNGDFHVDTALVPVSVTVILGDHDQGSAGQCTALPFNADGGPSPSCKVSGGGSVVNCR